MSRHQTPPTQFGQMLRQLGPGLIITASIVGSGELIVTPKLGAEVGFTLLWFIIIGCVLKVFVQVELGRFAISKGKTTLEAMNSIPGPRLVVSWLVWLWLIMYISLVFQVAGIMGSVADVFTMVGAPGSSQLWMVLVAASCAILLVLGKYLLIERFSAVMVALFTFFTILAVGALAWTPYSLSAGALAEGLTFQMPASFTTAFAAFGIIGVGASELIYYPYWCLEKGYGHYVGPKENTSAWFNRARGWVKVMKLDAWVSMIIYTLATIAFYLLGAAVLHGKQLEVTDIALIETLSHMYQETFGGAGLAIFIVGALIVLFSTAFVATASNARLFADAATLFRLVRYDNETQRLNMIKAGCVLLPAASLVLYLVWGRPVTLVLVGALAQGLMLPFLAIAALYFRFRQTDRELQPGMTWTFLLGVSAICMTLVGIYQVNDTFQSKVLNPPVESSSSSASPGSASTVTPTDPILLFNQEDLSHFSTWLADTQHEDPRKVFTVTNGFLRISGDGLGYLRTRNEYRDYQLVVEFKWGDQNWKWGDRIGRARDSGIFLHATGPDGNSHDGQGAFMAAIECNLFQGATGDLLLIRGDAADGSLIAPKITAEVAEDQDPDGWFTWQPGGPTQTIERMGRLNWANKSPDWQDQLGFRGPDDVEKPYGQWNRIECICDGDQIRILLNGTMVNEARQVDPNHGHILLQCEGSEIFFRKVELQPLN